MKAGDGCKPAWTKAMRLPRRGEVGLKSHGPGGRDSNFSAEWEYERARDLTFEGDVVSKEEAWSHLELLEGVPLVNDRSGFVAVINKPQRKELKDINKAKMSAQNGFSVDAHYTAVSRIEKLFKYAIPSGVYPDLKHGEQTVRIHRFACPIKIKGEKAVAWLTAKQTTNVEGRERLYNLELVDIEMLAGIH